MKLKIAHILPHYYPSIGGVEKVAKDLCEGLVNLGHDVTVLTTKRLQKAQKQNKLRSFEIINGVKIFRYNSIANLGHMSFTPSAILNIINNNYEIIHLHSLRHPHTVYTPILKKIKNFKLVLQGHTHFHSTKFKTLLYNKFDKVMFSTFYKDVDIFLYLNKTEKNKLINFGIPEIRLSSLYNPVNESLFQTSDTSNVAEKYNLIDKKVILFLGQAHSYKRIDLLIKALPGLISVFQNTILLIAGPDFGNYPSLIELAKELNVENNVKFLGLIDEGEKELLLKRCDVLILPSEYEAFGVVLAEAMACGKPVIATKTPGPIEIVKHGENGFLIEKNSSEQIIYYTTKLFKDEELRIKLGNYAQRYAEENFSLSSIVLKLEKIYMNCLNNIGF